MSNVFDFISNVGGREILTSGGHSLRRGEEFVQRRKYKKIRGLAHFPIISKNSMFLGSYETRKNNPESF
jgi:hypothetical protein